MVFFGQEKCHLDETVRLHCSLAVTLTLEAITTLESVRKDGSKPVIHKEGKGRKLQLDGGGNFKVGSKVEEIVRITDDLPPLFYFLNHVVGYFLLLHSGLAPSYFP